jgi:hypothetical protein
VLQLASILLLGFLLPYSTGNELGLLQNARREQMTDNKPLDSVEYLLQMSLEKRLEKSVMVYNAGEFGEFDALADGSFELALDTFLRRGLAPLLSGRPFHRSQVDLLHLLAMAIHPHTTTELLPQTARYLNAVPRAAWIRTQGLLQNSAAQHFQIHAGHRFQMVQLLATHLTLPCMENDLSAKVVGPLLHGALPHVRAALRGFAKSAMAPRTHQYGPASWQQALQTLVSVAVQTKNVHISSDEWNFQLHQMLEDKTDHGCGDKCTSCGSLAMQRLRSMPPAGNQVFCPHKARGQLLATFITRRCQSRRRRHVGGSFLKHALGSLTDAIEWQVDCSTVDEDDDDTASERYTPCLLASLFFAVKHCFYFLPTTNKGAGTNEGYDDHCETLVESAIQCLHHPNTDVVKEALGLLTLAFTYRSSKRVDDYAGKLLEALKSSLLLETKGFDVENVVAVASQKSPAFASFLYNFLVEKCGANLLSDNAARWIAAIASNSPSVVTKDKDRLLSMLEKTATKKGTFHLMASLLSLRHVRYFAVKDGEVDHVVRGVLRRQNQRWDMYQLAKHALVTGNFGIAAEIYRLTLASPLKEKHFLWISALAKLAQAELSLSYDAAKAIPSASTMLRSAVSYLQSLPTSDTNKQDSFGFQIRFLLLRLDFLDLITILRQLTREMRLTGRGPAKHTRPHLHLQNLLKSFIALSSRYRTLYQQYGMEFHYSQSRHSVATFQSLCIFMTLATRAVFSDVLPAQSTKVSATSILPDSSQPMVLLIRRLDELVVQPMDTLPDTLVRAAAMLELIDGIIMVPIPFPSDFLSVRPTSFATLRLCADPDQAVEYGANSLHAIESYPSLCFSFVASGSLPESMLVGSRLALSTVLVWYRFVYKGPLLEEDAPVDDKLEEGSPSMSREGIETRLPNLSSFSPVVSRLFSNGRFFIPIECPPLLDEGVFEVEVRIGARDVNGAEWEIPVEPAGIVRCLQIRVSRSR